MSQIRGCENVSWFTTRCPLPPPPPDQTKSDVLCNYILDTIYRSYRTTIPNVRQNEHSNKISGALKILMPTRTVEFIKCSGTGITVLVTLEYKLYS